MIGTGATGAPTIPEVANTAGNLAVSQRTPNWCAPLHNSRIDADEMAKIKAGYPEMFSRCQETFACFLHTADPRSTYDVTPEEREALNQYGPVEIYASSEESVGDVRLRQFAQCVIQRYFRDMEGAETVGFSHGQFGLVVEPLDHAAGELLPGTEVVEDQCAMRA